jgi:hypothetical protein
MMYRIEVRLNQHGYQKILEEHLHGTIQKYNLDASEVIFQQDNAPIHSTISMKQWFSRQHFWCFILACSISILESYRKSMGNFEKEIKPI